jgi:hypothetical protein
VRKAAFLIVAFAASLAVGQVSSPANGVKEKVCTLATCLTDDVPKPAAEAVTVDFELMKSMHMAIQVKVNDAGPYRLIFDLGSPLTLISGRAAADGGLISQEKAKKKTFFGMRGDGKVKRLQVGELVAEDVPVMIMDHPTIEAAAEFLGPLDGIVGYPFFARYKFTIDYSTKKMTFTPGDYKPQNVMTQMFGRMFSGNQKKLAVPGGLFGLEVDKPDDDDQPGVVITRVYAGSPAADAGLLPTDRLMTLDGRWTDTVSDAVDAASFAKPGEPITISVRRGEQTVEIVVRPSVGL